MTTTDRRLPAEWEPQICVLTAWPHKETDWAYMLPEVTECFRNLISKLSEYVPVITVGPRAACAETFEACGFNPEMVTFADIPTNDTWARDFGPLTITENGSLKCIDFKFNAWGLKFAANFDNLITLALESKGLLPGCRENRLGFVLEGGSIESDGKGTILTTEECLLSPNRNGDMTKTEIESYLNESLGSQRVLWLSHGALAGDDTDSHIDTLARFAPNDTIIYCGPGEADDPNTPELVAMRAEINDLRTADGKPYHLVELPLPDPIYDEDGMQLPATYANFLITNGAVLMPTYRQPRKDTLAAMMLQSVFTDRKIVPIDCLPLIRQHGSLHCVTMQFPK